VRSLAGRRRDPHARLVMYQHAYTPARQAPPPDSPRPGIPPPTAPQYTALPSFQLPRQLARVDPAGHCQVQFEQLRQNVLLGAEPVGGQRGAASRGAAAKGRPSTDRRR